MIYIDNTKITSSWYHIYKTMVEKANNKFYLDSIMPPAEWNSKKLHTIWNTLLGRNKIRNLPDNPDHVNVINFDTFL